jgi:hypothetical protein
VLFSLPVSAQATLVFTRMTVLAKAALEPD